MLIKKMATLILSLIVLLSVYSCASISSSPAVTQINKDGKYMVVVNKRTFFLYIPISSRNVVLLCSAKDNKCQTLNLWNKNGFRIW